jgi:hypothetical protein
MLSVAYKEAIPSSFAPNLAKVEKLLHGPIEEVPSESTDTSFLSDLQELCVQFESDPSVITSIESELSALCDIPCYMFTNLTFTPLVMTFVAMAPNDIDASPTIISALHVLATITTHRLIRMCELAQSVPNFYTTLVRFCGSRNEPVVRYSLWTIANMLTTAPSSGFFALIKTPFFNMYSELLLWQCDKRIVTLLALILKRSTSQFATPEYGDQYLDLLVQVLTTGAKFACQLTLRALSKFVRIDPALLQLANSRGLLRDCIPFLAEAPLMGAALSLYSRVVAMDDPNIIAQLGQEGIIEALYQPLESEREVVQLGAMQILMRVLVADETFLRTALDSGIVEQLCARAIDGTYSGRARAVHAICEICYCDHSLDVWQKIVDARGIDAICEFLTVGKEKTSRHTILALSHIVNVAPGIIGPDMVEMILEEMVKIADDPANQENPGLLCAARGLYLDITDEEMRAEIGDIE